MKQQNSAFSPRWTFHPSLTPAGSSAPQEPNWDSPQARLLLWTIVGTSHPGGFCLQGFPPCCKDTICASPPPSECSWPFHLLHTWKHQNNPRGQASNRCAAINTAAHAPCAPRAPPGMHGSSPSWTPIPQSQGHGKEPSREPISWTHSLHSQVDSLYTPKSYPQLPQQLQEATKFLCEGWTYAEKSLKAISLQAFAYGKERSTNKARAQDAKGKLNPCELLISYTVLDLTK